MSVQLTMTELLLSRATDREETTLSMDETEFQAFYERTARPLWAYLSRVSGKPEIVDDLLQESYYRFVRANSSYESESHRRNSLFQIATNLVRDNARRSQKRHSVPLSETSEAQTEDRKTPNPSSATAVRTDLARAMEQLEPIQREILWLAYAQGVSHDEIAEQLGLRSISIRTLLLRARRRLAQVLGEDYRVRGVMETEA